MLQPGRKVVLSDLYADEFLVDIDAILHLMARKGIVNVVSAGDQRVNLDANAWSPMVTEDPEDGRAALHDESVVLFPGGSPRLTSSRAVRAFLTHTFEIVGCYLGCCAAAVHTVC